MHPRFTERGFTPVLAFTPRRTLAAVLCERCRIRQAGGYASEPRATATGRAATNRQGTKSERYGAPEDRTDTDRDAAPTQTPQKAQALPD